MNKNLKIILEIDRKIENSMINIPINKIKFNMIFKNILTVSYDDGIVDLISLSEDFFRMGNDDVEKLRNVMQNINSMK